MLPSLRNAGFCVIPRTLNWSDFVEQTLSSGVRCWRIIPACDYNCVYPVDDVPENQKDLAEKNAGYYRWAVSSVSSNLT